VYEENPFGSAAPAPPPPPPAAGSQNEPGCPDEGGDNWKSECKLGLADRIIAESATVLKNKAGALPLKKRWKVALVGSEACAKDPLAQGGGSGWNGFACNEVQKVNVKDGIAALDDVEEPSCPEGANNAKAGDADVIVAVVAPAKASEGTDRETLQLSGDDVQLIRKYGSLGKKLVVVINAPGPMITSTWDAVADSVLITWLPGQRNGRGIAQALYGEVNEASGRLPFTFPKCSTEACTPEDELSSVALGDKISSKEYRTFSEKALIGYRWYHAQGIEVSYPFGFGLFAYGSAEVEYSKAKASVGPDSVTISAQLVHSGPREGRDVPQLYVSFPKSVPGDAESKPEWVLKGFSKVALKPGEAESISFVLPNRELSYWDDSPGASKWVCAEGTFKACVGANARDAVLPGKGACTTFQPRCVGTGSKEAGLNLLSISRKDDETGARLVGAGPVFQESPAIWAAALLSVLAVLALARLGRVGGSFLHASTASYHTPGHESGREDLP
jgi:beta-glucosidase